MMKLRNHQRKNAKKNKKKKQNDIFTVEDITGWRYVGGKCLFNVSWSGFDETENTWEPIKNVAGNDQFQKFVKKVQKRLVERDESGLIDQIMDQSPKELKKWIFEKYLTGDNHDKLALQQIFKMTEKQ